MREEKLIKYWQRRFDSLYFPFCILIDSHNNANLLIYVSGNRAIIRLLVTICFPGSHLRKGAAKASRRWEPGEQLVLVTDEWFTARIGKVLLHRCRQLQATCLAQIILWIPEYHLLPFYWPPNLTLLRWVRLLSYRLCYVRITKDPQDSAHHG